METACQLQPDQTLRLFVKSVACETIYQSVVVKEDTTEMHWYSMYNACWVKAYILP